MFDWGLTTSNFSHFNQRYKKGSTKMDRANH